MHLSAADSLMRTLRYHCIVIAVDAAAAAAAAAIGCGETFAEQSRT